MLVREAGSTGRLDFFSSDVYNGVRTMETTKRDEKMVYQNNERNVREVYSRGETVKDNRKGGESRGGGWRESGILESQIQAAEQ